MKALVAASVVVLLALGCGKGELDPATLNTNPFDPDYNGPAVFQTDSTYLVTNVINGVLVQYQAIAFHVHEELFTAPAEYSVLLVDRTTGLDHVLQQNPGGSNRFVYLKAQPQPNSPVCVVLRLYNNLSASRPEEACVTLIQ